MSYLGRIQTLREDDGRTKGGHADTPRVRVKMVIPTASSSSTRRARSFKGLRWPRPSMLAPSSTTHDLRLFPARHACMSSVLWPSRTLLPSIRISLAILVVGCPVHYSKRPSYRRDISFSPSREEGCYALSQQPHYLWPPPLFRHLSSLLLFLSSAGWLGCI